MPTKTEMTSETIQSTQNFFTARLIGPEKKQLHALAAKFADSYGRLQELQDQLVSVNPALILAREELDLAQTGVTAVSAWLLPAPVDTQSAGRMGVIIGRVRQVLGDPAQPLPWALRWLRVFGVKEHPYLKPFIQAEKEADENLKAAQQEEDARRIQLQLELHPQIQATEGECDRAGRRFMEFCDTRAASSSRGLAIEYTGLFPDRLVIVAHLFARAHAADREELRAFPGFVDDLRRRNPELFERVSPKGDLLNGYRVPTPDEFLGLPDIWQQRWKTYLTCYFGAEAADNNRITA